MIAFFFTMPMSRIIPMTDTRSSSLPVTSMARSAPSPADGIVERIVSGWIRLS
jgi:hypothetical protein